MGISGVVTCGSVFSMAQILPVESCIGKRDHRGATHDQDQDRDDGRRHGHTRDASLTLLELPAGTD